MAYNEIGDKGYVSVWGGNNKTYRDVAVELYSALDKSKINMRKTVLAYGVYVFRLNRIMENSLQFINTMYGNNTYYFEYITIASTASGADWSGWNINTAKTINILSYNGQATSAATEFRVYY